jgi:hypothetical protein
MILRSLLAWLCLMVIAIGNGALREVLLVPRLGAGAAHVVSTVLLALMIVTVALVAIPWLAPASVAQALVIGSVWLGLTLAFEFGFGHWVADKPWRELFQDYNLLAGRVWAFIPFVTAVAPAFAAKVRGLV